MFNLQPFLDAANELTRLDEIERALNLLDNLPAKYRDEEPIEVARLRAEITQRIATPNYYSQIESQHDIVMDDKYFMKTTLRYQMLAHDVREFNKQDIHPHIVDYGPGPMWIAANLDSDGLRFTYEPIVLDQRSMEKAESVLPSILARGAAVTQPYIFCAFEIIEHLWNEIDIKIEAYKYLPRLPDIIHASTPMYAFDPECPDWRIRDRLGHLRAYTPKEFYASMAKMFKDYDIKIFTHQILHARLLLNGSEFKVEEPK